MQIDMEEIIEQLCPKSLKKVEQRGIIEGITQGQIECAKRFLKQGLDIPTVAKGTGLSEEKVASLQETDNAN